MWEMNPRRVRQLQYSLGKGQGFYQVSRYSRDGAEEANGVRKCLKDKILHR